MAAVVADSSAVAVSYTGKRGVPLFEDAVGWGSMQGVRYDNVTFTGMVTALKWGENQV